MPRNRRGDSPFDGEMWDDGTYPTDPDYFRPFTTYVVLVWQIDSQIAFRYAVTLFDDYGGKEAACKRAFVFFRRGECPEAVQLKPVRGRSVFDGSLIGRVEEVIPWGFYSGSAEDEIVEVVHGIVPDPDGGDPLNLLS